jgi:hypothetical protein
MVKINDTKNSIKASEEETVKNRPIDSLDSANISMIEDE